MAREPLTDEELNLYEWSGKKSGSPSAGIEARLIAEIRRLKRGDFTPEEFQGLCHHRDERPGCMPALFRQGCDEYHEKLFGRPPEQWPNLGHQQRDRLYALCQSVGVVRDDQYLSEAACEAIERLRERSVMVVCELCGNKRCPHANDHRNACTGSNEPGQPGSAYP